MSGSLLISEPPLQALPSLAVLIGLNEAIVLQQLHYWLLRSKNIKNGDRWRHANLEQWGKDFPFWSERTIKRIFANLKKSGLVKVDRFNKFNLDRTQWYTIDYAKLAELYRIGQVDPIEDREGQIDPSKGTEWPHAPGQVDPMSWGQVDPTNNQRLPETTTENIAGADKPPPAPPAAESKNGKIPWDKDTYIGKASRVLDLLNRKLGTKYPATTGNNKPSASAKLIMARLKDGYGADDFKAVIADRLHAWQNDDKMREFLRPQTLFKAQNFESYLGLAKLKDRR